MQRLVAVGLLGIATGYLLRGLTEPQLPEYADESDLDGDSLESEVEIDSSALNSVPGEVRMLLLVNRSLKMGKGKAAAQCAHAALALYRLMSSAHLEAHNPELLRRWERNGQAKITLSVSDNEEMDLLFARAMEAGINAHVVHDAGRTQIAAGSATVLGLGPAPKAALDALTGALTLY